MTNTETRTNRGLGILPARAKRGDTSVLLLRTDAARLPGHVSQVRQTMSLRGPRLFRRELYEDSSPGPETQSDDNTRWRHVALGLVSAPGTRAGLLRGAFLHQPANEVLCNGER